MMLTVVMKSHVKQALYYTNMHQSPARTHVGKHSWKLIVYIYATRKFTAFLRPAA